MQFPTQRAIFYVLCNIRLLSVYLIIYINIVFLNGQTLCVIRSSWWFSSHGNSATNTTTCHIVWWYTSEVTSCLPGTVHVYSVSLVYVVVQLSQTYPAADTL